MLCVDCKVELTKDNWSKAAQEDHWHICKHCYWLRRKSYRKRNRVHYNLLFRKANAKWKKRHPKKYKLSHFKTHLKMKYGITLEEFEALWKKQNGLCAICKRPLTRRKHGYSVDHNHKTNKIRGLLCGNCNFLLGNSHENPQILEQAILYLQRAIG